MATQEIVKQKAQVVKVTSIKDLIEQSAKELGKALPSHMRPERIVRIALTTLKLVPQLRDCNPQSFLGALFQCAQLGLEPNIEGQAYIIPYGGNAQFQIGYKGYVELFYRHQSSVSLDMQEVCANDEFDYAYGTESYLKHKPALSDRGEVIGYYAVAKMKDGAHIFKFMSAEDCMNHGKRYSKSFSAKVSTWQTAPDAMCKKTVLIQLMKLLPKSIEVQRALAMDETVKTKVDADMFNIPDEIPKEDKYIPIETQEVKEEREPGQEG
jgi:recombination protein RecT